MASADGTTTSVTINITGTNDPAVLSSATVNLTEANTSAAISTSGTLTISDVDSPQTFVTQAGTVGSYGTFAINTAGAWSYTASSAHDEFAAGSTHTDTFSVASADGTTTSVTINITGTNDAPVIGGTISGDANEAGGVSNDVPGALAAGTLTVVDVDTGESQTQADSGAGSNGYGTWAIDAGGQWTYEVNNDDASVQALNLGNTLTDTFAVSTVDGTTQLITVTIHGANDAALISGTVDGAVTEAGVGGGGSPSVSGTLTDTDVDNAANTFLVVSAGTDSELSYGTYGVTAGGAWTYTLDNSNADVQSLNVNETLTDTISVRTEDGTEQLVAITIHGANDAAVVSGDDTGLVIEAGAAGLGTPTATGTLTDTDIDNAGDTFQGAGAASTYGTWTIDTSGHWSYSLNNSNGVVQALNGGELLIDTFTVHTVDGTARDVTITINGANDAAVISGTATGEVDEAGGVANGDAGTPTASGTLTANDVDNSSTFQPESHASSYGNWAIDGTGLWSYTLNDNNGDVQALNVNQTLLDSFTVHSIDGTTELVTITINGANDAAVIGGDKTGSVTEAGGLNDSTPGAPIATGTLTDTDIDNPANTFQHLLDFSLYGSYESNADGSWAYVLDNDNPAVQALGAGATLQDTFTVVAEDGTADVVAITIHGTNDIPVIGGVTAADATEDVDLDGSNLEMGGVLAISDADQGQSNFVPQVATAGSNGFGTFTLDASGGWTYTADDSQTAIQQLGAGDSITDSFVAVSSDGTASQTVTVTIHGTNDVPVIGGMSTGDCDRGRRGGVEPHLDVGGADDCGCRPGPVHVHGAGLDVGLERLRHVHAAGGRRLELYGRQHPDGDPAAQS